MSCSLVRDQRSSKGGPVSGNRVKVTGGPLVHCLGNAERHHPGLGGMACDDVPEHGFATGLWGRLEGRDGDSGRRGTGKGPG